MKKLYLRMAFGSLDEWRSRFFTRQRQLALRLSDQEGLPRGLEGTGLNSWERGKKLLRGKKSAAS